MTDLEPVPDAVRALPAPADVGRAVKEALSARVAAERAARGDVHQPEDVYALARALAGARDLLSEYARAFSGGASLAAKELKEEHLTAVGEDDGVPRSALTVPDLDGTDIRFTVEKPNSHDIATDMVVSVAVADVMARTRDTEPEWDEDVDDAQGYRDRYELWMADVIGQAIDLVLSLGSYDMQVSKVRAYQTTLAGNGEDHLAGVVRGAITTTAQYRGVKVERKQRKK